MHVGVNPLEAVDGVTGRSVKVVWALAREIEARAIVVVARADSVVFLACRYSFSPVAVFDSHRVASSIDDLCPPSRVSGFSVTKPQGTSLVRLFAGPQPSNFSPVKLSATSVSIVLTIVRSTKAGSVRVRLSEQWQLFRSKASEGRVKAHATHTSQPRVHAMSHT